MFDLSYKKIRKEFSNAIIAETNSEYNRNCIKIFMNEGSFTKAFSHYKNSQDNEIVDDILRDELFYNISYSVSSNFIDDIHIIKTRIERLSSIQRSFMQDSHFEKQYLATRKLMDFIYYIIEFWQENRTDIYELYSCSDCGDSYSEDYMTTVHDSDYVCGSCLENYDYCDDAGTYLHRDSDEWHDYNRSDECESSDFEGVYRYDYDIMEDLNKMKMPNEPIINRKTLVSGLEIEMEARSDCPYDFPQQIDDLFHHEYCMFKGDGSLGNGFEMVTAPCTLAYHRQQLDKLFNWDGWRNNDGNTYVKAWNTDTCGLHINLNRRTFTDAQVGKFLVFINDPMNTNFITKISGRSSEGYAKRSPKKITDGGQRDYNKYVAVNLAHSTHIELRIFRGNVTKHGILRCLEFSFALSEYVKQCSLQMSSLHYREFLKWFNNPRIKSQYPYFNEWLVRKDYIKGRNTNRIVTNELNKAIYDIVNG